MDYQLNICPSSARDLQNVKADNITKQIKIIQEENLPALYKKKFGAAVVKFNDRVTTGKIIDNYYKSIVESNIPEVYKLSLIIRYDLGNKSDAAAIHKVFSHFKMMFEKEEQFVIVSVFSMSYDEYKELQIFFFPVSSGYVTGLSVRNDFIDVTKKIYDIKDNIDIVKAIPLLVDYVEKIFRTVGGGMFMSQEELNEQAHRKNDVNPVELHAIAVDALKEQMNALQRTTARNQQLKISIENEKKRIQDDIEWSKQAAIDIQKAEFARLEEERRIEEERLRIEAARKAYEAQKREEERLRGEERRVEAERFVEQTRRNIELKKYLAKQDELVAEQTAPKHEINLLELSDMLTQHMSWQIENGVESTSDFYCLNESELLDERKLSIKNVIINDAQLDSTLSLVGIEVENCEFMNCDLSCAIIASSIKNCVFINCKLRGIKIDGCRVDNIDASMLFMDGVNINESFIENSMFKDATVSNVFSAPETKHIACNFNSVTFSGCDMKHNTFEKCDFTNAAIIKCDMRESEFVSCNTETMAKEGSLFKGVEYRELEIEEDFASVSIEDSIESDIIDTIPEEA